METSAYLEINQNQFKAFSKLEPQDPVVMLNFLRFKKVISETGISGEEAYQRYMKAAMPFFNEANAEVLFYGEPKHMLIGPLDTELWDKVLLIKYNTLNEFLTMVQAKGYPSHLRKQALIDSRLIHCKL